MSAAFAANIADQHAARERVYATVIHVLLRGIRVIRDTDAKRQHVDGTKDCSVSLSRKESEQDPGKGDDRGDKDKRGGKVGQASGTDLDGAQLVEASGIADFCIEACRILEACGAADTALYAQLVVLKHLCCRGPGLHSHGLRAMISLALVACGRRWQCSQRPRESEATAMRWSLFQPSGRSAARRWCCH